MTPDFKSASQTNVEVFSNVVRISVGCHGFADDLFGNEMKKGIRDLITFCLELYNELVKSTNPLTKALPSHFYD